MELERDRRDLLGAGVLFAVLVITGNAMQGGTPALHGEAEAVVAFYADRPTRIAIAMSLSLVSLFFLAWFLSGLLAVLDRAPGGEGRARSAAAAGGAATVALLAAGFSLNAAGALRAGEVGIAAESAVVFYDGSLALTGLAAPLAMSVLLAGTAVAARGSQAVPRWLVVISLVLAVLGIVTPLSFVLSLLFPVWVLAAAVALHRTGQRPHPATRP